MQYISTRGSAPALDFESAVLAGLASDGGLYVPAELPQFDRATIASFAGMNYPQLAFAVMRPFVAGALNDAELRCLIEASYADFRHPATAPLVQLDHNLWLLELFHGPTLAFKDFALQFLGRLLDLILQRRGQRAVIMGATSGDTGSAAIEGCRRCANADIFILHPHQRISAVQRRQMTTVRADNVHNIAVRGSFDDCQNIVKASFADSSFLPADRQLVAVNSINWARIMAQIVYYFYAAVALGVGQREIAFAVPTGNFGDMFAGYLAHRMGLPVARLVVATNANDILHRCFSANDYSLQPPEPTLSPSMDIMISSNFERLLFDLYDRDAVKVADLMAGFKRDGKLSLSDTAMHRLRALFASQRLADSEMLEVIAEQHRQTGYLLDPHSAIGVAAGRHYQAQAVDLPMVCLATAHPAKFPQAAAEAGLAEAAALPPHLSDLLERAERYEVLDCDTAQIQAYIAERLCAAV
ncbi:MAG: threonine synthase [Cellvibrionales bacterium]|nr:threonine synthase [Cellvibrionales bacterium]